MKNIYLKTTLILFAITATLATIGLRPVQQKPVARTPVIDNQMIAQAGKTNSGT
jgi:hypothetical protein